MLLNGAGLWHSPNGVQLAWGANFGPATQDGEWWRLGTAMFLHFGVLHLLINMWALWDGGQWVERMYGPFRFTLLYATAGLFGNLLSLVMHAGQAVSGGASGAIFGVYGALLSYLWHQRRFLRPDEFRWLFWGALGFSGLTIVFGLLIPGIDNAAHVGGLLSGLLLGRGLLRSAPTGTGTDWFVRGGAISLLVCGLLVMLTHLPAPAYRWRDELRTRQEISEFMHEDAVISRAWNQLLYRGQSGRLTFEEIALQLDNEVVHPYEASFEELSALPSDPSLPSAQTLDQVLHYAQQRRDASRALVEGLRLRDRERVEQALEMARRSAGN